MQQSRSHTLSPSYVLMSVLVHAAYDNSSPKLVPYETPTLFTYHIPFAVKITFLGGCKSSHIVLSTRGPKLQMIIKPGKDHNFPGTLDHKTSQQALMRVLVIQIHMRSNLTRAESLSVSKISGLPSQARCGDAIFLRMQSTRGSRQHPSDWTSVDRF